MGISSIQLDAFLEVAREGSFSKAAKNLFVTQSALSQRILNLEDDLGITLFIREPSGARLTDAGNEVLRYCQSRESLESELLAGLQTKSAKELAGRFAVGGFSSIMRSCVIPGLAQIARSNPMIRFEFMSREIREIPALLERAQADAILLTHAIERPDIESVLLGHEENVLVRPTRANWAEDVFLDHDADDTTTNDFFRLQKTTPTKFKRRYMDEIYSVIDGVIEGYGQAIIPKHLSDVKGIEVVRGMKPMKVPIYAMRFKQAFYTRLQGEAFDLLVSEVKSSLKV
ncbi:MAG: LysR family transcriptional regulator [Bdellovibrionota bacterium]